MHCTVRITGLSFMSGIFGGATFPLKRAFAEYESGERSLGQFARHAFVDHFAIDLDSGLVELGPLAREYHGFGRDQDAIGIRQFLDCYHEAERQSLLDLLEQMACDERPFHYTATLAGPGGRFVHGYISRCDDVAPTETEWSGVIVMSRSGLAPSGAQRTLS
jgi:hypothetical protein